MLRSLAIGAVLGALSLGVSVPAQAATSPVGAERTRVAAVNTARAQAHAPRLMVAWDLTLVARRQAQAMARSGRLYHSPALESKVSGWVYLGENVGYGASSVSLQGAFMRSAPHRANILNRAYTQVGIGAAYGHGYLWTAEVFRRPANAQPARTVARPSLRYGSRGAAVAQLQRALRVRADGVFGAQTRAAVMRFQRAHRLCADGVVGTRTWRALGL